MDHLESFLLHAPEDKVNIITLLFDGHQTEIQAYAERACSRFAKVFVRFAAGTIHDGTVSLATNLELKPKIAFIAANEHDATTINGMVPGASVYVEEPTKITGSFSDLQVCQN